LPGLLKLGSVSPCKSERCHAPDFTHRLFVDVAGFDRIGRRFGASARWLHPDCKVPRISLCPGCTVNVTITVLQNHECHINYGSLGAMHPQKILVSPKRGRYWAVNETTTSYSPGKGFLGSDYFETRFEYELMNGSPASAVLKAGVEVVPHF
jgi:hypothetical protein